MKHLLNSAVLAAGAYGTYDYQPATAQDLTLYLAGDPFISGVGYPETADMISRWTGTIIPLSRAQFALQPGDSAMVVRLRYRVADPSTKGQPVSQDPNDWEIALLRRLS